MKGNDLRHRFFPTNIKAMPDSQYLRWKRRVMAGSQLLSTIIMGNARSKFLALYIRGNDSKRKAMPGS